MKQKSLRSMVVYTMLSSSLYAGFDSMTPLQSSSHTSNTASQNEQITITWNQAIANNGDNLGGYYYILDQNESTLIPNVVDTRSTLGASATSVTVTKADDGVYHFHLAPYADSGNIGATMHFKFIVIDKTAPTALTISPNGGSFNTVQTVSLNASDTNSFNIYYTTDGTNPTAQSTLYSVPFTISNTQTIQAIAIDGASNASSVTSAPFTINNTSNVALFGTEVSEGSTIATTNAGDSTTFVPSVSVTGSSITEYKYKIDSGNYSGQISKNTPISLSGLSDGLHSISILGYDGTSLQAEADATTLNFTVDNTAPSNVNFSLASGSTISTATTVTLSGDNDSTIYYTINGSAPDKSSTQGTSVNITESNNGTVTLRAIAYDAVNNQSTIQEAIYTVNISSSNNSSSGNSSSSSGGSNSSTTEDTSSTPENNETTDSGNNSNTPENNEPTDSGDNSNTPDNNEPTDSGDNTNSPENNEPTDSETTAEPSDNNSSTTPEETPTPDTNTPEDSEENNANTDTNNPIDPEEVPETPDTTPPVTPEQSNEPFNITLPFINTDTGRESVNITSNISNTTQTTNSDGTVVILASNENIRHTLEINSDGTMNTSINIGTSTSLLEVNAIGADTQIGSDGNLTTSSNVLDSLGNSILSNVYIKNNGTVINTLSVTVPDGESTETIIESDIIGTNTTINNDGSILMVTPTILNTKKQRIYFEIRLTTVGEVEPTLSVDDVNIPLPNFEPKSKLSIKQELNKILLNIDTILSETITFN